MNVKHREVVQWLQEVYGEEHVPAYEKSDRSINILHQLMTASKLSENNDKILAEDYSNKTLEYTAEARQLRRWMEPVNIQASMLSEEGQMSLSALANTAQVLDVQLPTSTNIILATNQLEMEHMKVLAERKREHARTCQLLEMSRELSQKLEEFKGVYQQAEANWAQQQKEHAKSTKQEEFIREKGKNYTTDINYYEAKLNQVGVTKSITHDSLSKQWTELQEVEKKVSKLDNQLKSYTLPPDMALAQVEVQAARQELSSIMDEVAAACKHPCAP